MAIAHDDMLLRQVLEQPQRTLVDEFRTGRIPLSNGVAEIDADEAVRYQHESGSDCVCLLAETITNLEDKAHDSLNRMLTEMMDGSITYDRMNDLRDVLRSAMTRRAQESLNQTLERA